MKRVSIATVLAVLALFSSCKKEQEISDPIIPVVLEDGPLLSGRVIDTDGNPIAGIPVTDGFAWTETDADGNYKLISPCPERVRYVSVRIPSVYAPLVHEGRPVFYSSVPSYNGKERKVFDIVLQLRSGASDNYTMLMMADPQAQAYEATTAAENIAYATRDVWEDVFGDMRTVASSVDGPCYGMCLGDIAQNSPVVYSQYCLGMASIDIPFWQVIGNHDHFTSDAETDDDAAYAFESVFGPRNYSFDLGQFHFVVLDNCIYVKGLRDYPFKYGLEDEFLTWLKADLERVPKDMPVMVCTHANVFTQSGVAAWVYDGVESTYKLEEFLSALQGFDKVYVWMGHWHLGGFLGKVEHSANVSGVEAFTVARVAGQLSGNLEENSDGTPRGYVILEASGKDIRWRFRPIKESRATWRGNGPAPELQWGLTNLPDDAQFRVYPRGSYDDDFVYANVFLWDKHWGTPTLRIGGEAYPMVRDYVYDLAYRENVRYMRSLGVGSSSVPDYMSSGKLHHFRVRVPDNASGTGILEVTDRFGQKWSQEVEVGPINYTDGFYRLSFDFRTAPNGCPSAVTNNISFTCPSGSRNYSFTLSSGRYVNSTEDEEGYLSLVGSGCTLKLPVVSGRKLVSVSVHNSGNATLSCSACIKDGSGAVVTGGESRAFWGNGSDTWILEKTEESTAYYLCATGSEFRVGSLRLAYRGVDSMGSSGDMDTFVVDKSEDIDF